MANSFDSKEPTNRVAAGIKTAMLVCVIGFIALAASRVLMPAAVPLDEHVTPTAIVAPARTLADIPQAPASDTESAAAKDDSDSDNHPSSF